MSNDKLGPLTRALVGVPVAMLGVLMDVTNRLAGTEGEAFFQSLKKFVSEWKAPSLVETAKKAIVYLRRLYEAETITVGAADGTETFASSGLFTGRVYGSAVPAAAQGKATAATKVTVWEMILDGTFAQLFGSLGKGRRRWTEAQVCEFVRAHRDKLRTDGYATFFELEGGFVARVHFGDRDRLHVYVYSFSDDDVWYAQCEHRLVSLQQAA
jgi:hypothetical protein